MKPNILMMGPIPQRQMATLEEQCRLHRLWQSDDPEALLNDVRHDIAGVVSVYGRKLSGKLIRALPNLEIISHFGVGYDNIDMTAAKERGIIVTNTPDVLTDDTADLGMGLT